MISQGCAHARARVGDVIEFCEQVYIYLFDPQPVCHFVLTSWSVKNTYMYLGRISYHSPRLTLLLVHG